MTYTDHITQALAAAVAGEALPSFGSAAFRELVAAINEVSLPGNHHHHERIGRAALCLLLEHLQSGMQAERTLAVMRDNGQNPC